MNFNNIPKGLLAPLFFGEISINGNVPDGLNNGGSNPPVISCAGATDNILVRFGGLVESTPVDQWVLTITDLNTHEVYLTVTNNTFDQELVFWQVCEQLKTPSCPFDFSDFGGADNPTVMRLKPEVADNVRIRLDAHALPAATETEIITIEVFESNPTLSWINNVLDNYTFDACFAYGGGEIISCEGAANLMSFSQIAGVWEIYIDDMEAPSASGTIGSALAQLSLDYLGRISFDYDGFAYIQNQENLPHRIKFKPISATSFTANNLDNPTFMVYEDGSLTFCLAAAVIV